MYTYHYIIEFANLNSKIIVPNSVCNVLAYWLMCSCLISDGLSVWNTTILLNTLLLTSAHFAKRYIITITTFIKTYKTSMHSLETYIDGRQYSTYYMFGWIHLLNLLENLP